MRLQYSFWLQNFLRWQVIAWACMLIWAGCSTDSGDDDGTNPSPTPIIGGESPSPTHTATPLPGSPTPTASPTLFPDADDDGFTVDQGDCDDTDASSYPGAQDTPYDGIDQDCENGDLTDVDGDGYSSTEVTGGVDCDDENIHTYPGASEIGDGKDNNCDGQVDEGLDTVDHDGDGYSAAQGDCDDTDATAYPGAIETPYDGVDQDCSGKDLTDIDGDGSSGGPAGSDCDDENTSIYPGAQEVPYDTIDQNCDGFDLTDVDEDGHNGGPGGDDCDDSNPARYPGATEVPYDGIDQDCDGRDITDLDEDGFDASQTGGPDCDDNNPAVNPGVTEIAYDGIDQDCSGDDLTDVDLDGFPSTAVAGGTDCDDNDLNTYPGAVEFADGKDNNCDGVIDNNLNTFDDDGDGFSEAQGDCNDADHTVYPGATEVPYDGLDQNCDGKDLIDVDGDGYAGGIGDPDCNDNDADVHPGATEVPYDGIDQDCTGSDLVDVDRDGYASTAVGGTDCNDDDPLINPGGTEIPYDGIDQDCSGRDLTDVDGDGYDGTAVGGPDCNDANAAIHPGAKEVCDGIDNNCDSVVDSDATDRQTYYTDADRDTFGNPNAPVLACSQTTGLVRDNTDCDDTSNLTYPGAKEICDTKDNSCDGSIDEGVTTTYYQDSDGDGFGNTSPVIQACSVPAGYSADSTDCDDTHATVYPGAVEVCDLLDNNCNGSIDEGVKLTWYLDLDEDGYGDPAKTTQACTAPAGYVADGTDCNDKNSDVNPGALELCNSKDDNCNGMIDDGVSDYTYYQDNDKDGYGNSSVSQTTCTAPPAGYVLKGGDCNDSNASISPAALEQCNGIDDNCNSQVDEGIKTTYYRDVDGDGYGNKADSTQACTVPTGYVTDATDCDDTNAAVNPGAKEVCNGIDDNCSASIDENVKTTWYQDSDKDTYGNPSATVQACTQPAGYVANNTDCNDASATVYPGAAELCNGVDDDCDTIVDDGVKTTYYLDGDKDGYGNPAITTLACSVPTGYVSNNTDCNDSNAAVNPAATETCNSIDDNCNSQVDEGGVKSAWYRDADGDGYGNANNSTQACTQPTGYVADKTDCNDSSASVNPAATESCNAIDDNCDGVVDEGVKNTYFKDADSDSYGNASSSVQACSQPAGYVSNSTDCDDSKAGVYPGATETCNGIDDNCDSVIDEGVKNTYYQDSDGDSFGNASASTQACAAPTGYVTDKTDCNDKNNIVYPGAPELCDSLDNNCNGQIDDGVLTYTYYYDGDKDGYGTSTNTKQTCAAAPAGYVSVGGDCNDADASVNPSITETCNAIDDNCNGSIDEGVKTTYYHDVDGDGYGNKSDSTQACTQPTGYVADSTDCNDNSASVHPGTVETCNGIDDNCSGVIDEGVKTTYYKDNDGDTYGNAASSVQACSQPSGYVTNSTDCNDASATVYPGATETCNGVDDDCDTISDDGVKTTYYQDNDKDGYGSPSMTIQACTAPAGYVSNSTDCNDANPAINPGATETCNGIDDNCSNQVDEGVKTTYYRDSDGDGYGNPAVSTQGCSLPGGYVTDKTDCNDSSASVYPGATETCNSVDDNCDGAVDEGVKSTYFKDVDGDGYGNAASSVQTCTAPTGYVSNSTDCDDSKAGVNPGATETCNGIDDNCDTAIDEGVKTTWYRDSDDDGFGNAASSTQACTQPAGYVTDKTDCNDRNDIIYPGAPELCDNLDNNCNSQIDDGVSTYTYYFDADLDGYGTSTNTKQTCAAAPSGYVALSGDCNDTNPAINPGATETCNGLDDNCNSSVDEGAKTTWYQDADGDSYGNPSATTLACSVPAGYVANNSDCNDTNAAIKPGATESCDGVDDNCNGVIDENVKTTFYLDTDGDGYGVSSATTLACTQPTGYAAVNGDCNNNNPAVNPGATEFCNGVDDNCNSVIDENVKTTWYLDADNDGYGVTSTTTLACNKPTGYSAVFGDCNDSVGSIYPGAPEQCNSVDDNCNGVVDDGVTTSTYYRDADADNYGNASSTTVACSKPTGYVSNSLDCNDSNASVNPGATEVVNGVDDNCDGAIDYFTSCKQARALNSALTSGILIIDPDQTGPGTAFQVYCDMSTDGGGWTLMAIFANGDSSGVSWSPNSTNWVTSTPFGTSTNPASAVDAKSRAWAEVRADEVLITRGATTVEVETNTSCLSNTTFQALFDRNSSSAANCAWSCSTKTTSGVWTGQTAQDSNLRFRCADTAATTAVGGYNISSRNNSFITTVSNSNSTVNFGLGATAMIGPLGTTQVSGDFDTDASTTAVFTDSTQRVLWGR